MLGPLQLLLGVKLDDGSTLNEHVLFLTDGRNSGAGAPGNVFVLGEPEAYEGGPIALVRDGDYISVDHDSRSLKLDVSDEELIERKKCWEEPEPRAYSGTPFLMQELGRSPLQGGGIGHPGPRPNLVQNVPFNMDSGEIPIISNMQKRPPAA